MNQMRGEVKLEIVPGATHPFEEAETLARVAELAGTWFTNHLQPASRHDGENVTWWGQGR
jgi:hypothetical protein